MARSSKEAKKVPTEVTERWVQWHMTHPGFGEVTVEMSRETCILSVALSALLLANSSGKPMFFPNTKVESNRMRASGRKNGN